MKKLIALLLMLTLMAVTPALAEEKPVVVATTYQLYDVARIVGGEFVEVKYAPENAQEVVKEGEILFCLGGEDDAWTESLEGVTVVRVLDKMHNLFEPIEGDNEIMAVPINCLWAAMELQDVLSEVDAANKDAYTANTDAFTIEVFAFDKEIRESISNAAEVKIKGSDGSMAYFAAEYGLQYAPDAEDAIALNTYSNPSEEDLEVPYLELMRRNLDALIAGTK